MTATDEAPLATLLRTSTVVADAPMVARIRRLAVRRRRRRRTILIGAAAVPILVLAAVRVNARFAVEAHRLEAVEQPVTTTGLTPPPSAQPVPSQASTGSTEPVTTTAFDDIGTDQPPILLPAGDWELRGLSSTSVMEPVDFLMLDTDEGDLGPLAFARFNADADTLDYADGPVTSHDTTSPGGRTVRVGHDGNPDQLTAIFLIDGGSVAVGSHDIPEADLLTLVDTINVVDGLLVTTEPLPAGLRAQEARFDGPALATSYSMHQGTTHLAIQVRRRRGNYTDIRDIRYRPNVAERIIGGRRSLLSLGDKTVLEDTQAVIVTDDWVYHVTLAGSEEGSPVATLEALETVIGTLTAIDETELLDRLPELQDRRELLGRWFADAGPAADDLDWMLDGPPMSIGESSWYQPMLTCAVVLDWVESGDPATLDRLDRHATWAVNEDLEAMWRGVKEANPDWGGDIDAMMTSRIVAQAEVTDARFATTKVERRSTTLVQNQACGSDTTVPG